MNYRHFTAVLAVLVLTSCATEKAKPPPFDKRSLSVHVKDLVNDSSVFGSAISSIRAGRPDAAVNRLELAQDVTILKLDELIPYTDDKTQLEVVRELQSIKADRKRNPRREFVGSGQPYDEDISNIIYRAQSVLDRVEE
jgi:hypothetical protein